MQLEKLYINVILPLPLPKLYTYCVPPELSEVCYPGTRVIVPFGAKKMYTAIINELHYNKPESYEPKEIISVLDVAPIVTELQLKFWKWIADYYMCPVGDVYKAAVPTGFKLESETNIVYNDEIENKQLENLLQERKLNIVLSELIEKKYLTIKQINNIVDQKTSFSIIKKLIENKIVWAEETVTEKYKSKKESFIILNTKYNSEDSLRQAFTQLEKAPQQLNILMLFLSKVGYFEQDKNNTFEIRKKDLLSNTTISDAVVKALVEKEIFFIEQKDVSRLDLSEIQTEKEKQLNEFQETAFNQITKIFNNQDIILLHGITSSGKTEVYIKLIKEIINQGKQVLYLLPEIALTGQIINRIRKIFGNQAGIYHSKYSDAERVETWDNLLKINDKTYKVILGVRSSIFLPFKSLGLIIIDEEHETTFKQFEPSPRYHARDSAIMLAKLHGAKVLLGTATPSFESYLNATTGKYGLVEINNRYANISLPQIIIADIADERKKKKMKSIFSSLMLDNIAETLNKKEQIILFQNRRGFAPFIQCVKCGWVPKCKYCDVSLTYHKFSNKLVCHYCSYTIPVAKQCGACNDTAIETKGFGTEKIEDEIAIFFPEARLSRLDLDTTRSKKAYDSIIGKFEKNEVDILIGTQMVTKGLDFNNVSLVGILNADNLLNFPDFRAFERSFQLMSQVSGRAGRHNKQGKVIIQTSNPYHSVIQHVIKNNFKEMYNQYNPERQLFKYPPFYRLIYITLKHKDIEILNEGARYLANDLKNILGQRVLGPEFPYINRIQGLYLKNIIIKIEKEKSSIKMKEMINNCFVNLKSEPNFKAMIVVPNVDPF